MFNTNQNIDQVQQPQRPVVPQVDDRDDCVMLGSGGIIG